MSDVSFMSRAKNFYEHLHEKFKVAWMRHVATWW